MSISQKLFLLVTIFLNFSVKAADIDVSITWDYENFPLKIELYGVLPDKASYISETRNVSNLKLAPVGSNLNSQLKMKDNSSKSAVLVVKNTTKQDYYFFAVPHVLMPHTASAGHYFECLCIGRVFKVAANSVFYRIVRVNLNKEFTGVKKFTINHQIVGISEKEALSKYKERLNNE